VIFYTDILIPIIGSVLLWLQRRYEQRGAGRRRRVIET